MTKKLWTILLLALFVSSVSLACGKKSTSEKKSKDKGKTAAAAEQAFMQKNAVEYQNIKAVTGMVVYAPDYLPAGLEIQRVTKIKESGQNPAYYEVDYSKGLTISGNSDPDYRTDADFIGEFDLGGKHLEEHSYKNNPKSYQLLWHSSKATYVVSVISTEGLTRDDIKKIAESMKPIP